MLQNAYFLAKIGADTAENEQHFSEILPKTGNYPTSPVVEPQRPHNGQALEDVFSKERVPVLRIITRSKKHDSAGMKFCLIDIFPPKVSRYFTLVAGNPR